MAWTIDILRQHCLAIEDAAIRAVVTTGDCISLVLLAHHPDTKAQDATREFATSKASQSPDNYDLDKYWILYYELYRLGRMGNPYPDLAKNSAFDSLACSKVAFCQ